MRIGTRGSALALWQARAVAARIEATGGPTCELVVIRTSGDERAGPPDAPIPPDTADAGIPIKRLFVKEIEDALLDGRIDLAVHSSKDLPAELSDGLMIAATLEREDPRDALILPLASPGGAFADVRRALGASPRIGTSSVRRAAVLRSTFPDATFLPIRGNVDTRLGKLDAGECNALVLAAAGVTRLGLAFRLSAPLPVEVCLPAPGQGIVAVEIAVNASPAVRRAVARIDDPDASEALLAERAVVRAVGGGCQMPLAALATLDGQDLEVRGLVASLDGGRVVRATVSGHRGGAAAAGEKLAAQLLALGAGEILSSSHTK